MNATTIDKPKHGNLRTLRNGIFWSSKYISGSVVNALFTSYISFYATDVLGMSLTLIATVLLVTKSESGSAYAGHLHRRDVCADAGDIQYPPRRQR